MAIDLRAKLEQQINQAKLGTNLQQVQQQLTDLRLTTALNKSSVLGNFTGEVQAGFRALNSVVDDVQTNIPDSIVPQQTGGVVIAQLTDQIPEVASTLIVTPTEASSIQALTGTAASASAALLDVVITTPTPQAVADNIKVVANASNAQLENITKQTINLSVPPVVDDLDMQHIGGLEAMNLSSLQTAIGSVTGAGTTLYSVSSSVTSGLGAHVGDLLSKINTSGFGSIMENTVENLTGNATGIISGLAVRGTVQYNFTPSEIGNIVSLTQSGSVDRAVSIIQKHSDRDPADIRATLLSIDNSIFTNITKAGLDQSSLMEAVDLRQLANSWKGANSSRTSFTIINSKEELEAEMLAASREITEVIVHWSHTGTNQNFTAGDLHEHYLQVFNVAMPYHYILTRDGNIQRGRPLNEELKEVVLPNNHQRRSIHVCFVGGINRPVGKSTTFKDIERYRSKQSFTLDQWSAFKRFVLAAKRSYPGIEFLGHKDIDPTALDPGFDVRDYVQSTFGFKSFIDNPQTQAPPTREQIATNQQPDPTTDEEITAALATSAGSGVYVPPADPTTSGPQ